MSAKNRSRESLRIVRAVVKARAHEVAATRKALAEWDARARVERADGRFRDRIKRARGAEAVAVVERYRVRGLRGAELRAAVERHANMLRVCDPEFAGLLLETPLVSRELKVRRQ